MKFCTFTLIDNSPDPITGVRLSATLDQLSGGRLDIIIGKGNDPDQNALFGYDIHGPWDRNAEKYELLRQLIREEELTWSGRYRPDLIDATTQPRPLQDPLPIWHGSASSTESTELAAKWGDPLFSANGFHPLAKYAALIDHYRQRWVDYGRDSADAVVGAGFNGLYVGKTSQQALEVYRPIFTAFMASPGAIHNKLPFTSLEDFLETGSVLVGSPEQIIDKFGRYQAAFGHELSGIATEVPGLPDELNRESVERFVGDVVPVLRAAYPSRVWA